MKEQIILVMPIKNAAATVARSIQSFLHQKKVKREIILVIGNDQSTDNSQKIIDSFLPHPSLLCIDIDCGTVSSARNYLTDYVRDHFPHCILIGRLDADDTLASATTLHEIENQYDIEPFDVLIAGNQQQKKGCILPWENRPSPLLLDETYLLRQLEEMKNGNPKAELPSCNTFIKPSVAMKYPPVESAEDHWFTVQILLQKNTFKIHIAPELLYCIYSLDGTETSNNLKNDTYIQSRTELYNYYKKVISA